MRIRSQNVQRNHKKIILTIFCQFHVLRKVGAVSYSMPVAFSSCQLNQTCPIAWCFAAQQRTDTSIVYCQSGKIALNNRHMLLFYLLYRKTPGGVFLTLVKKTGSADQRSRIFYHDKKVKHSSRTQRRRRKKTDESESVKMEQQTEATLHNSDGILINCSGPLNKVIP